MPLLLRVPLVCGSDQGSRDELQRDGDCPVEADFGTWEMRSWIREVGLRDVSPQKLGGLNDRICLAQFIQQFLRRKYGPQGAVGAVRFDLPW